MQLQLGSPDSSFRSLTALLSLALAPSAFAFIFTISFSSPLSSFTMICPCETQHTSTSVTIPCSAVCGTYDIVADCRYLWSPVVKSGYELVALVARMLAEMRCRAALCCNNLDKSLLRKVASTCMLH